MLARTSVILPAAAALALLAAGCGSSSNSGSKSTSSAAAPAPSPAAATNQLKLAADAGGGLSFSQKKLAAKSGTVTIAMTNPKTSGKPHGIAIQGNGVAKTGPVVASGKTSTLTVSLKPGTYTFYCPVTGHRQAGMQGTLIVAGAGSSGGSSGGGSSGSGSSGGGSSSSPSTGRGY